MRSTQRSEATDFLYLETKNIITCSDQLLNIESAYQLSYHIKRKNCVLVSLSLSKIIVLPDVLVRDEVVIYKGLIDFRKHVQTLRDLSKHSVNTIQIIQILCCGDQKLGAKWKNHSHSKPINNTDTDTCVLNVFNLRPMLVAAVVHHRDGPFLSMLDPGHLLRFKKVCLITIQFTTNTQTPSPHNTHICIQLAQIF